MLGNATELTFFSRSRGKCRAIRRIECRSFRHGRNGVGHRVDVSHQSEPLSHDSTHRRTEWTTGWVDEIMRERGPCGAVGLVVNVSQWMS